jgi:hypothetical protein
MRPLLAWALALLCACTANAPHRLTPQGQALEARIRPGDLVTAEGRGELVEIPTFLDRFQKHLNERDPKRCRLVMFTRPATDLIRDPVAQTVLQNLRLRRRT